MRIYLQMPILEQKPPRFYHIHLQKDLLGGWTLVTETGIQGASGRVRRQHFEQQDEALEALERTRDQQMKRGYRIVYAEGDSLDN